MMRKSVGALLVLLVLSLALAACSDDTKPKVAGSCDEDTECGSGICFDNQCYAKCAAPGECSEGQFCVYQVNDAGAVALCLSEAAFFGCEVNADCPTLLGDPCRQILCAEERGLCELSLRADGGACDLSDGSPGTCLDGSCACVPDCEGRDCEGDGCGGTCGTCGQGFDCVDAQCVLKCVPDDTERDDCDGVDNDCDGMTDEDFFPVSTTCYLDACMAEGVTSCEDGEVLDDCITPTRSDEQCSGVDDDCDGLTDGEDPDLLNAGTPACEQNQGVCAGATKLATSCVGGRWLNCGDEDFAAHSPLYSAGMELRCDGLDNDCDGETDEDFSWTGLGDQLVLGAGSACGLGACAGGLTECDPSGAGLLCPTMDLVGPERCNGVDDDCDGFTDAEDAEDLAEQDLRPCELQAGSCAGAMKPVSLCLNGSWFACTDSLYEALGAGYEAGIELSCDGVDNDCDGSSDEDFLASTPDGLSHWVVGAACGSGRCAGGVVACAAHGLGTLCSTVDLVEPETCNGLDDDCDGLTDSADALDLLANDPAPCKTQAGVCQGATASAERCVDGTWRKCAATDYALHSDLFQAEVELSCDGEDNDCDGEIDEDFELLQVDGSSVSGAGAACGIGACAGGTTSCNASGLGLVCTDPGLPTAEICDGEDNDCDGLHDAEDPNLLGSDAPACELQDGVCAGAMKPALLCVDGAWAACTETEYLAHSSDYIPDPDVLCDALDNDCDAETDEDYAVTSTGCGVGACSAEGELRCEDGEEVDSCVAGEPALDDASCDGVDDDCSGDADEDYLLTATACGVGACAAGGELSCVGGQEVDSCVAGEPADDDPSCDGLDDDCSGQADENYIESVTSCGIGACAASGDLTCVDGLEIDSCVPGEPALDDASCDGVDDDCDGDADEDYLVTATACGVGACAAGGELSCVDGQEVDSCVAGEPAADDASCDGVDEDCSGEADEDYLVTSTSCGIGACAAGGDLTCVDGVEVDSCVAGEPASGDASCDGVDDDCSGEADEDYLATSTVCGVGACVANGQRTCESGAEVNSCVPGTAAVNDLTCDGVDDNCDGATDEDYVVTPTSCGFGACAAAGQLTCDAGSEVDSCQAGEPGLADDDCDDVDDNCNGATDEGYVATPTSCGVGACVASGQLSCVSGAEVDSCTPGTAAPTDLSCDGVDDNCNGTTDEGYVVTGTSCGVGACAASGQLTCDAGAEVDSCTSGTPGGSDADCDDVDDNCNGATDEGYVATPTSCGVGACVASGQLSCVSGAEVDSCTPGDGASSDLTCDGVDDNCNGTADEGYQSSPTTCGTGACLANGQLTCDAGSETDSCQAGVPGLYDDDCDNVDDNCNGATDEEYAVTPTACGVGICAASGQLTCESGAEIDSCTAGTPAPDDTSCDGLDSDCNGATDEDYVVTSTSCGLGVCAASGQLTCDAGTELDDCAPGTPGLETCNGLDDDCDGDVDAEDLDDIVGGFFVYDQPACGNQAGVCAGSMRPASLCNSTGTWDACGEAEYSAHSPSYEHSVELTCDGLNNNCDQSTDESFSLVLLNGATVWGVGGDCGVGVCSGGLTECTVDQSGIHCPTEALATPELCNLSDDDCDGAMDEPSEANLACDDGNDCTVDFCGTSGFCETFYESEGTPCNDGDACTIAESCYFGTCMNGIGKECTDSVGCTLDSCDSLTGQCFYTPSDASCNDGDECTTETCDAVQGCLYDAVICDDNNPCTDDYCDYMAGCWTSDIDCSDAFTCTDDSCDIADGSCIHTPNDANCADDIDCTVSEVCDPDNGFELSGCLYGLDDTVCNDDLDCTWDFCFRPGPCIPGPCTTPYTVGCNNVEQDASCEVPDNCDAETCDSTATAPGTGCVTAPIDSGPCDSDSDLCTVDECYFGECLYMSDVTCNDFDMCTTDSCDPVTGACDYADLDCDDSIACTFDWCDSAYGMCMHNTNDGDCDDADPCTIDSCSTVDGCVYTPYTCDDGVDCTVDTCDAAGDCIFTPSDALCTAPGLPFCSAEAGCAECLDDDGDPWDGCTGYQHSEFHLHSEIDGEEDHIDLSVLSDGRLAAVWHRQPPAIFSPPPAEIRMRVFEDDGSISLVEAIAPYSLSTSAWLPRVVPRDGGGGYMVSWGRDNAASTQLEMRPFDPSGQGPAANTWVAGGYPNPSVHSWDMASTTSLAEVVHVWSQGSIANIYARRYSADGNVINPPGLINVTSGSAYDHSEPRVAQWDNGAFVVVWEDTNGEIGSGPSVVARIYDTDGTPLGEPFVIEESQWMGQLESPDVAVINATGQFVVVWLRTDPYRTQVYGVVGRKYNADGSAQGAIFEVRASNSVVARRPVVAIDENDLIAVAWENSGNILARAFEPNSAEPASAPVAMGSAFMCNRYTSGFRANPAIAKFSDGSFIVGWESCGDATVAQDEYLGVSGGLSCGVYARRFTESGGGYLMLVPEPSGP